MLSHSYYLIINTFFYLGLRLIINIFYIGLGLGLAAGVRVRVMQSAPHRIFIESRTMLLTVLTHTC
jgi:hypothetical protein